MSDEILDWKSRPTASGKRSGDYDDDHEGNDENIGSNSTSSLNKRVLLSIDRLSQLTDSLILHILTFVETPEAAKTCVLSKRWQFLWSNLPVLTFSNMSEQTEKICEFVASIRRTLASRTSHHFDKIEVEFNYRECCASDVNDLVEFALKHNVKHISLGNCGYGEFFVVPQLIYSNSSLTCLTLSFRCFMNPQNNIEWRSLTRLELSCMELYPHAMEKVFSGCPVLYELSLRHCWGLECLEINCGSLRELKIQFWLDSPVLEISAPYIHSLTLSIDREESRKFRLVKIPSVVRVNIGLLGFCHCTSEDMFSHIKEVFEDIQHVKNLELDKDCIQALSILLRQGWRFPQSWRDHLIINATTDKHSTPVILDLLDSSPNLKTLIINPAPPLFQECGCFVPGASYFQKCDTRSDLLHLKTVTITCCSCTCKELEPILTLVQILLRRAILLEKIVIDLKEVELSALLGNIDDIDRLLLEYPRSSPKAEVILCK